MRWGGWGLALLGILGMTPWALISYFVAIPPHWVYLGGLTCWGLTAFAANQTFRILQARKKPLPQLELINISFAQNRRVLAEIRNASPSVTISHPIAMLEITDGSRRVPVNHLRWNHKAPHDYIGPGHSGLVELAYESAGIRITGEAPAKLPDGKMNYHNESVPEKVRVRLIVTGSGGVWKFKWITLRYNAADRSIEIL